MNKSSNISDKKEESPIVLEEPKSDALEENGIFGSETISLAQIEAGISPATGIIVGQPDYVLDYPGIAPFAGTSWLGFDENPHLDQLILDIQKVLGVPETGIMDFDTLHGFEIRYGCTMSNEIGLECEFVKGFQHELNQGMFF